MNQRAASADRRHPARFWLAALASAAMLLGCGGGGRSGVTLADPPPEVAPTPPDTSASLAGTFAGGPVIGLDYSGSVSGARRTDGEGRYRYAAGETLRFAIGDLPLGSAPAADALSPLALGKASTASAPEASNRLVLLQTLDVDGDLNNGIQLSDAVRGIVSKHARAIDFSQPSAAFRASLAPLLAALEEARVFTDLDPRPRTAKGAVAAQEHFQRATRPRQVVMTAEGALRGFEAGPAAWQYLGIPYAQPPVGDLRWRAPQPAKAWSGVREAVGWPDQSAQISALERFGEGGMSEDSLYLHVTAPKSASKLPVMVWFHGGGFTSLTGNTKPFNNPGTLVGKGVVQVSVNHRLGPFGYIAHPALSVESGYGGSGNYGQMDLVMALKWVKANIAAFGGDPDNVTIFGESGGGRKVLSLMASPSAAGLFHKAISQSGTLIRDTRTLASAEAIGLALQKRLGAASIEEMRGRPWTEIVAAFATLVPYTNIDNRYLPHSERVSFESRTHNDVPFMLVVNTNDTPDPIETARNVLPWMSQLSASKHYAALFSQVPGGWRARGVKTNHAGELPYVFNAPDSVVTHYLLDLVTDPATGSKLAIGDLNGNGVTGSAGDTEDILTSAGFDGVDAQAIENSLAIWTQFARSGSPSVAGLVDWPAYVPSTDIYVELGASPIVRSGLSTVFP
ncbi:MULTISPECIES: carboxylesterase family protein [unclassified Variovorax]|uniref:carboxylesterase family protein n=1 Tax=unclassified Variovorax TaxID=663243 RepID=UPI00257712F0|nr:MULTISPECIES: carboxylesterase family protein [unclassified Variovorax]MDM0090521.1 carboxylesterase family protein [Variovorax sp. J22G40]MDM0147814.1 carboxylesterase family protein [Variovorax sp. J2P1-31]